MPPMPPPMPPPGAPPAPGFSGRSATIASVVIISDAIEAAFCKAVRTTLVGSMMPDLTRSLNAPLWASKPQLYSSLSSTLPAITAPSSPAFSASMAAGTALAPSRTMACASTVAVVVPSPAMSLVLLATSRTICAPMFSNLSASSISLATVTPSLVMRGAPKLLSMRTLRPLGPSVTFTASARMSTPRIMRSRASPPKRNSFAAMFFNPYLSAVEFDGETAPIGGSGGLLLAGGLALDDAHDVGLLHDQEFLAIELHFGAGPLAEQDAVAGLHVEGDDLARFVARAGTDGDNLALHRLFLGGVGDCLLYTSPSPRD